MGAKARVLRGKAKERVKERTSALKVKIIITALIPRVKANPKVQIITTSGRQVNPRVKVNHPRAKVDTAFIVLPVPTRPCVEVSLVPRAVVTTNGTTTVRTNEEIMVARVKRKAAVTGRGTNRVG